MLGNTFSSTQMFRGGWRWCFPLGFWRACGTEPHWRGGVERQESLMPITTYKHLPLGLHLHLVPMKKPYPFRSFKMHLSVGCEYLKGHQCLFNRHRAHIEWQADISPYLVPFHLRNWPSLQSWSCWSPPTLGTQIITRTVKEVSIRMDTVSFLVSVFFV